MPYFKNNDINLLFIHIPKTGGSSVEQYLSNKYNIELNKKSLWMYLNKNEKESMSIHTTLQHITYKTIIQNSSLFDIEFDDLKIITIVRNPYERLISDLFYLNKININTTKEQTYLEIKKHLFINTSTLLDNHNIPQYLYVCDENNEIYKNIKILHTETLDDDMKNIGFTDFDIRKNCNIHKLNYYNYLNNNSIKLINNFYNKDFEIFNYQKISE
jgi:hypothetical protein